MSNQCLYTRFVAVYTQAARLCTVRQAKLQLCVVLTCVLLYNVPRFGEAYLDTVPVNDTGGGGSGSGGPSYVLEASYTWLGNSETYRIIYYNILYAVLMLAVPLVALSGLNVRLIRALTALRRKRAEMQASIARVPRRRHRHRHPREHPCDGEDVRVGVMEFQLIGVTNSTTTRCANKKAIHGRQTNKNLCISANVHTDLSLTSR